MHFTVSGPQLTGIQRRLQQCAKQGLRTLPQYVDQAARLCAISCAIQTQPFGTGAVSKALGEFAVRRDIRKVYMLASDAYGYLVKNANKGVADAFYFAFKHGDMARARGLLRIHGFDTEAPIQAFDGGALHRKLRDKRGRIPIKNRERLMITNANALKEYEQKEVNLVGFAKAGWANAARRLGSIRGLKAQGKVELETQAQFRAAAAIGLEDGSKQITANWILRHKAAPCRIFPNYGDEARPSVVVRNEVGYSLEQLSRSNRETAIRIAYQRMFKAAKIALAYELKKMTAPPYNNNG